jgi:hypothetical protein
MIQVDFHIIIQHIIAFTLAAALEIMYLLQLALSCTALQ